MSTIFLALLLTVISIAVLVVATFATLVVITISDCGIGLLGNTECESPLTRRELAAIFLLPPTITAVPAGVVARLAGLRWRYGFIAGWLVAFGALAVAAAVLPLVPHAPEDWPLLVFYAAGLLYAAVVVGAWLWWRRRRSTG